MEKHDTYISADDAFTGRWMYFMSKMRPSQYNKKLLPEDLAERIKEYEIDAGIGFDAHFCPDYGIGLELGWQGLLDKLDYYREENSGNENFDPVFYDCHARVIRSVQFWIQKHIDELESMIVNEEDEEVRRELEIKRDVNRNIKSEKPSTLREAMQWILWFHLASRTFNRDGAGGQLDTLLQPFFERDLKEGRVDRDEAVYLMGCFLINDPIYWQIGGPDENGIDQTSDMSFIILDGAEYVNTSLNITMRVHEGMDQKLFDRAVELLIKYKEAWPRFSGDKALVQGFMNLGFDEKMARKRIAVGCNWMSLPGMEYTLNDLFKVNMAKVFEISWGEMMNRCGFPGLTNDIGNYVPVVKGQKRTLLTPSTELLWDIFQGHLSKAIHTTADAIRFHLDIMKDNEVELLLNLLSHGPIEKGLDVSNGGAMFYNLAIDGAGLATVADSFGALEQRVETEARTSWSSINHHLRTSWASAAGEEHRLMMRASSRYGQGGSLSDNWADRIAQFFSEETVKESDDPRHFIPGLFSWAKPHIFGNVVGATPDGRRYGEPITHGANPNPAFCDEAAALSQSSAIARVQPGYGNTAPLQLEFDPFSLSDDPKDIVKALILSHFELGGTLINVNIFDRDKILEAHKDPSLYPDLVVRVTGFTAYFSMLTPEFRQVLVDRILVS